VLVLVFALTVSACGSDKSPSSPSPTPTPTPTPSVTLQSVALSANLGALTQAGNTAQVTATGTFSNGTTQNITSSCTNWFSDAAWVLTIDQGGLMTARGSGDATVTTDCQGRQGRGRVTLNLLPAQIWSYSGKGNTVFEMPRHVRRIHVRGVWDGRSTSNLIIRVGGTTVVNEILRELPNRTYEGDHLVTPGTVEVRNSTNVAWTLTELR
jgi:hypothetical protein